MRSISYHGLTSFVWLSHKLKRLAIKLTKWTGKSRVPVHPKHLLGAREDFYWFLQHLDPNDSILDVGCGNGMNTLKAASKVRTAVGIELDAKNLNAAQQLKTINNATNVEFVLGNATKPLPFKDHSFDKILFFDVLEHIVDRQPLLKDLHRVIKPTGKLLLSVPNGETRWRKYLRRAGAFSYSDPDHKIEYSRESLTKELQDSGFRGVRWLPSVYDTPWVGFFDLVGGFSLSAYEKLGEWKRKRANEEPDESIGFWVICEPINTQPA